MHMSGLLVRREDCNHVPGLPIAAPTAAGSHPLPRKCTCAGAGGIDPHHLACRLTRIFVRTTPDSRDSSTSLETPVFDCRPAAGVPASPASVINLGTDASFGCSLSAGLPAAPGLREQCSQPGKRGQGRGSGRGASCWTVQHTEVVDL